VSFLCLYVSQLQDIKGEMEQLEAFDTMQVVKRELANKRLKRDLDQCKDEHSLIPTDTPAHGMSLTVTKLTLTVILEQHRGIVKPP